MTALPSPASAGVHAPRDWPPRLGLAATAAALGGGALWFQDAVDPRLRALAGVVAFLAVAGACSAHLRAVNLRLVVSGLAVQVGLAVLILEVEIAGVRPGHELFAALATVATQFLEFTSAGSQFVFGVLADPEQMAELFPDGFILAFASLPILIFMSAVFMVLYHLGVLQLVVKTDGTGDGAAHGDERRRESVGRRERVSRRDRGADHHTTLYRGHDPVGTAGAHDSAVWPRSPAPSWRSISVWGPTRSPR